jgi:hypothetical protein
MANVRSWSVGVDVVLCIVFQNGERVAGRDCEVRWVHTREIGTSSPPMLETIGRRGLRSTRGDGWCWRCMRARWDSTKATWVVRTGLPNARLRIH